MSKRTPYDTGKRSEPKVWTKGHIESDEDYGKVDFEDDAGGTIATLYIEQGEDGTYTLRGHTNQPLKLDIEANDPSDPDITVTTAGPPLTPEQGAALHGQIANALQDADGGLMEVVKTRLRQLQEMVDDLVPDVDEEDS